MFRYRLSESPAYSRVRLAIGTTSVEAKVGPHPLFSQVKQIQLKSDELNLKCLEFMQKGQVQIATQKSAQFVKRCKEVFALQPQLVCEDLSISIMLGNSEGDCKTLDLLQFGDLLSLIKVAFDKNGVKLHAKIMRKIRNYTKTSRRRQSEKEALDQIVKSYKDNEKIEDEEIDQKPTQTRNEPKNQKKESVKQYSFKQSQQRQEKRKQQRIAKEVPLQQSDDQQSIEADLSSQLKPPSRAGRRSNKNYRGDDRDQGDSFDNDQEPYYKQRRHKKDNWQGGRNSSRGGRSNDRYGGQSKEKKYDPKIMLGISGDTEAGWRQRYRPQRVPKSAIAQMEAENKYQSNRRSERPQKKEQQRPKNDNVKIKYVKEDKKPEPAFKKEQKPQTKQTQPQKLVQPSVNKGGNPNAIFVYPRDGETFNFNKVKDSFSMLVNGSFWVSYDQGSLQIKKGDNGYVRDSKIDVIGNGFMAEGLTISLGGSSNIEDGGDAIGNPVIQDFTGSSSQFFHVITLQVFPFGEQLKTRNKAEVKNDAPVPEPQKSAVDTENINSAKKQEPKQTKVKTQASVQSQKKPEKAPQTKKIQNQIKKTNTSPQKNEDDEQEWQDQGEVQDEDSEEDKKEPVKVKQEKPKQKTTSDKKQLQQKVQDDNEDKKERQVRGGNKNYKKDQHRDNRQGRSKERKGQQQNEQMFENKRQKSRQSQKGNRKFQQRERQEQYNKSQSNRSRSRGSSKGSRGSKSGQKYKEKMQKAKIDPKILMGINGNTENGWHEIHRPPHVPSRPNLTVEANEEGAEVTEDKEIDPPN